MTIETDYLIVGAGACGMAFADALVARSDADVILVDRHHRPGGHWNDDYGFVRLHQPSAYYGVDSVTLGADRIDEAGPNAGFYERASGAEMVEYFTRVLETGLLPTGRVRFLGMTDHVGDAGGEQTLASLLTGDTTTVRVRRRVVDATYIQTTIPSLHKPSFSVDPGVRLVPPNALVSLEEPAGAFTVIGAGKTSMDTVCWLVDQGVDPGAIRWIRSRDPWIVDRTWMQPLAQMQGMAEWLARQNEAAIEATDPLDFMRLLEEKQVIRRLDPDTRPSVYRGATLSEGELRTIRSVTDVVRMGRVLHLGAREISLEAGTIPTRAGEVIVDCSASGLGTPPTKPIFEPGRITIQRVQIGVDPFSASYLGVLEASDRSDEEKNRLAPPIRLSGEAEDVAHETLVTTRARAAWMAEPDLREWQITTRLSPFRDAPAYMTPELGASLQRYLSTTAPAIANLQKIAGRDAGA